MMNADNVTQSNDQLDFQPVVLGRTGKPKRFRTNFTDEQASKLETIYEANRYIHPLIRRQIAKELNLKDRTIKIWFQNRRMKEKQERIDHHRVHFKKDSSEFSASSSLSSLSFSEHSQSSYQSDKKIRENLMQFLRFQEVDEESQGPLHPIDKVNISNENQVTIQLNIEENPIDNVEAKYNFEEFNMERSFTGIKNEIATPSNFEGHQRSTYDSGSFEDVNENGYNFFGFEFLLGNGFEEPFDVPMPLIPTNDLCTL